MIYVVFTAHSKGLLAAKHPQIVEINYSKAYKPYVLSKASLSC